MNNMYEILSDNLVRLRKSRKLTQAEFADIIKYSDKSVSKWETGMSVPSLETLVEIADFYGMTIDELIRKPVDSEKVILVEKIKKTNKLTITLLSIVAVWLVATVVFVALIFMQNSNAWLSFIWALPATFILAIIFSSIWNRKFLILSLSFFLWTIITSTFLQLIVTGNGQGTYLLYIVGIPLQIVIFLTRNFRREVADNNAEKQSLNIKKRLEKEKLRKQLRELDKEKTL